MKKYIMLLAGIVAVCFAFMFLLFWFVIGTADTSKWQEAQRAFYVILSLLVCMLSTIGPGLNYEDIIKYFDRQDER